MMALRDTNEEELERTMCGVTNDRGFAIQLLVAVFIFLNIPSAFADPPFFGTIFLDPDIIKESDRTSFVRLQNAGLGNRLMYDRRVADWVRLDAFLFNASYDDGLAIEIQVNPEFESEDLALAEASKYAPVIGRLPTALRKDVETVWIHKGVNPFGGGNNNLLIHTGQADLYERDGILEETLVHEASHSSLDSPHSAAHGWQTAQVSDPAFISTYARDNPIREDIAESFLLYLAVRHRSDRISQFLLNQINDTIPNRIAYFDSLDLNMYPVVTEAGVSIMSFEFDLEPGDVTLSWQSKANRQYVVEASSDLLDWSQLGDVVSSTGEVSVADRSYSPGGERLIVRVRAVP